MANGTALLALPAGPLARSPPLRVACGRRQGCGIRPDLAPLPRALWRGRCRGLRDAADAPPVPLGCVSKAALPTVGRAVSPPRSGERRVGEECRSRWSPDHLKKKA